MPLPFPAVRACLLCVALLGSPPGLASEAPDHHRVGPDLADDRTLAEWLAPYAADLQEQLGRVIGQAPRTLRRNRPDSALAHWVGDAMLWGSETFGYPRVDVSLSNHGGLRTHLPQGPVTMRHIYELAPFDNNLVVLRLDGRQMRRLAAQYVRSGGGHPLGGMLIAARADGSLEDVRIGGQPVDPERIYTLLTVDYLADGNGPLPVLWENPSRKATGLFLRDVLLAWLEAHDGPIPTGGAPRVVVSG